jgi:hypothetical protein
MTRAVTLRNIGWPVFVACVAFVSWCFMLPLAVEESVWLGLVCSAMVTSIVCGVVYLFLLMRPAFRWLTLGAGICAGAFMLYYGHQHVPVWIFVPGAFGIVWIRYVIEGDVDLESLGKEDVLKAAGLALLLCFIVVAMGSVQKYFEKRSPNNNSAVEELISWE